MKIRNTGFNDLRPLKPIFAVPAMFALTLLLLSCPFIVERANANNILTYTWNHTGNDSRDIYSIAGAEDSLPVRIRGYLARNYDLGNKEARYSVRAKARKRRTNGTWENWSIWTAWVETGTAWFNAWVGNGHLGWHFPDGPEWGDHDCGGTTLKGLKVDTYWGRGLLRTLFSSGEFRFCPNKTRMQNDLSIGEAIELEFEIAFNTHDKELGSNWVEPENARTTLLVRMHRISDLTVSFDPNQSTTIVLTDEGDPPGRLTGTINLASTGISAGSNPYAEKHYSGTETNPVTNEIRELPAPRLYELDSSPDYGGQERALGYSNISMNAGYWYLDNDRTRFTFVPNDEAPMSPGESRVSKLKIDLLENHNFISSKRDNRLTLATRELEVTVKKSPLLWDAGSTQDYEVHPNVSAYPAKYATFVSAESPMITFSANQKIGNAASTPLRKSAHANHFANDPSPWNGQSTRYGSDSHYGSWYVTGEKNCNGKKCVHLRFEPNKSVMDTLPSGTRAISEILLTVSGETHKRTVVFERLPSIVNRGWADSEFDGTVYISGGAADTYTDKALDLEVFIPSGGGYNLEGRVEYVWNGGQTHKSSISGNLLNSRGTATIWSVGNGQYSIIPTDAQAFNTFINRMSAGEIDAYTLVLTLKKGDTVIDTEKITTTLIHSSPPEISFSSSELTVNANAVSARIEFESDKIPLLNPLLIKLEISSASGTGISFHPVTFSTSNGKHTGILDIPVANDNPADSYGVITVALLNSSGFTVSAAKSSTRVIVVSDEAVEPAVFVVAERLEINEGESIRFDFSSTSDADLDNVAFSISQQGEYAIWPVRNRIDIPAGRTATLTIRTVDDSVVGDDGMVTLRVLDGTGYEPVPSRGISVTVKNTDTETVNNTDMEDVQRYSVAGSVISSILRETTVEPSPLHDHNDQAVPEISISALKPEVEEGYPAKFLVESSIAVGYRLTVGLRIHRTSEVRGGESSVSVTLEPGSLTVPLEVATHNDEQAGNGGKLTALVMEGEGYRVVSRGSASVFVSDETDMLMGFGSAVLPEISALIGKRAVDATGNRISQAFSGEVRSGLELAGGTSMRDMLETGGLMVNNGEFDWKSLMGGSSFSVPIYPEGGETSKATFWGSGNESMLSGDADNSSELWTGNVLTGHLGFDAMLGKGMLTGLAASVTETQVRMEGTSDGETPLDALSIGFHPYIGLVSANGDSQIRVTGGYGVSEMEIDSDTQATNSLTGNFHTLGLEGSSQLYSNAGLLFGGRSGLNAAGESWLTKQSLNTSAGIAEPLKTVANHVRLSIEGTYSKELAAGHRISPSLSIGMRMDGRDGQVAFGYEIGNDVNYLASHGFSVDASGLAVVSGIDRIHGWELLGSMNYDAGADKLGVLAKIEPTWSGTGTAEQEFLWDSRLLDDSDDSGIRSNGASLNFEIGYGFTLADESLKFNPFAATNLAENHHNELRLGNRFRKGDFLSIEIEGAEVFASQGSISREVGLNGSFSW